MGMKKDKKTKQMVEAEVADEEAMKKLTEFIYPARWVVDHGPSTVHTSPHWTCLDNWNVSHFAVAPLGFHGGFYPKDRVNRLRIHDTDFSKGPGAKLYSCFWAPMFELWGGQGLVFEHPGQLEPGGKPIVFDHRFYMTHGMGRVSFANDDAAVSVEDKTFQLAGPRTREVVVTDGTGKEVGKGTMGPHNVLSGSFDGKHLKVIEGDRVLLDQSFPIEMPAPDEKTRIPGDIQNLFGELRKFVPSRPELECHMNHVGAPTCRSAPGAAKKITDGSNPAYVLSIARTCYRLGHLDEALRLAKLCPGPEADFIMGLVAWELGTPTDFGKAGPEADYLRALQAIQQGDRKGAARMARKHVGQVPSAWFPRLALAYWGGDKDAARGLAEENPASPEAQLVLKLLGEPHELDALLKNNSEAKKHVEDFKKQITKGEWKHPTRYKHSLPKGA